MVGFFSYTCRNILIIIIHLIQKFHSKFIVYTVIIFIFHLVGHNVSSNCSLHSIFIYIDNLVVSDLVLNNPVTWYFQNGSFLALLPVVRQHIIDGFTPKALDLFRREFDFFDKVTSISGVLFPLPKDERRAGIRRCVFDCLFWG